MITAADVRAAHRSGDVLSLLRQLGYPVDPIEIDPAEWRRGGVDIPWNGEARLQVAVRLRRFDLLLITGSVDEESITKFMLSYRSYNSLTKSVVVSIDEDLSLYDLSPRGDLRRLDIEWRNPSAHALDRLNLLQIGDTAPEAISRLFDRALDRESVTRRFFDRFRCAVREIAAALDPHEPLDDRHAEALLILSRLLFLSFVQEKAWLNGERRFLVDRLEKCMRSGENFFATVLVPLFFGVLNTPAALRTHAARGLGRIPYLNGGLFEPSPYERQHAGLTLPNELLQRVVEELFERFDFSVDEDDNAGLHVDPEMLGNVFESLMAAEERATSGSFYTPKEIVETVTGRAIADWLAGGDARLAARLEEGDVGTLARGVARNLLQKLDTITVLDPACGSGAFLLASLSFIERTTRALAATAGVSVPLELRRRIVERSLYGVDRKLEAVRLCELRLWLAIVSSSEHAVEGVPPLPNLDRNIMQGNSLLSPTDFLGPGRADVYHEWRAALRAQTDLIERYRCGSSIERPALARLIRENDRRMAATLLAASVERDEAELSRAALPQRDLFGNEAVDVERCRELQRRLTATQRVLRRVEDGMLDFFAFDVHFAPVIARGGFEIVVGNPPWVRNGRIDADEKRMYAGRYTFFRAGGRQTAFHQPDLSLVFFERATTLLRSGGVAAMVMPAKVLSAAYAGEFRARLGSFSIVRLDDWSGGRPLFDADTFPLAVTVAKARERASDVRITSDGESFQLPQSLLSVDDERGEWALVPPDAGAILRRLRNEFAPLEETLGRRAIMGVKTGDNAIFFVEPDRMQKGHLVTSDGMPIPLEALCRCVRGRDVRRWRADASIWMLWPPNNGWKEPPQWLQRLASARGVAVEDFRLAYVRPEHVGIKVAWKDVSRGMAAAVLPDLVHIEGRAFPLIPNQTLYSIDAVSLEEAHALSAILNSTVVDALILSVAERAKDAHFRYFGRTVARVPLPALSGRTDVCDALARLARRACQGREPAEEIDRLVAGLYRVTDGELSRLRRFVNRRLGRRDANSDAC